MNKPVPPKTSITPKVTTGPLVGSRKIYSNPRPRRTCACRSARSC